MHVSGLGANTSRISVLEAPGHAVEGALCSPVLHVGALSSEESPLKTSSLALRVASGQAILHQGLQNAGSYKLLTSSRQMYPVLKHKRVQLCLRAIHEDGP